MSSTRTRKPRKSRAASARGKVKAQAKAQAAVPVETPTKADPPRTVPLSEESVVALKAATTEMNVIKNKIALTQIEVSGLEEALDNGESQLADLLTTQTTQVSNYKLVVKQMNDYVKELLGEKDSSDGSWTINFDEQVLEKTS